LLHEVHIPWNDYPTQSIVWWNELCAKVVEHFGLPGGKYKTDLSSDWMKFQFYDEKDAFLCKIMLSEHLGPSQ
jgi:hypothetical protein